MAAGCVLQVSCTVRQGGKQRACHRAAHAHLRRQSSLDPPTACPCRRPAARPREGRRTGYKHGTTTFQRGVRPVAFLDRACPPPPTHKHSCKHTPRTCTDLATFRKRGTLVASRTEPVASSTRSAVIGARPCWNDRRTAPGCASPHLVVRARQNTPSTHV